MRVAEGLTGPDLPERLELVRAALPYTDRGRFEWELDQALDAAKRLSGRPNRLRSRMRSPAI